jgi:hypothetical protein
LSHSVEFVAELGEGLVEVGRRGWGLVLVFGAEQHRERDVRAVELAEARAGYLRGLVHLERGDPEAATEALRDAARDAPDDPEITAALDLAERRPRLEPPTVLTGHQREVRAVSISRDGRTGVSASDDGVIRTWDFAERRCVRAVQVTQDERGPYAPVVDADAGLAVFRRSDGSAELWDLGTGRLRHVLVDPETLHRVYHYGAYAISGSLVLAFNDVGNVRVWDAETGQSRYVLRQGPSGEGFHGPVAITPDARAAIAVGSQNRDTLDSDRYHEKPGRGAQVWDPRNRQLLCKIDAPRS